MEFKIKCENDNANIYISDKNERDGILFLTVKAEFEKEEIPKQFDIFFKFPVKDCYSTWSPEFGSKSGLGVNWSKRVTNSRLASGMPLQSILSRSGKNRLTIAVSDAVTPIKISSGVCEEDAQFDCAVSFFTVPVAPLSEYSAVLRLDMRDIPFYDSVYDVSSWWETECGYIPASVPEHAKLPINSLWYSFHQMLDIDEMIKECELSKPYGMDTVIIDDGWQTKNTERGFAYCGDWELEKTKIPDMHAFVERMHSIGMKVMLWYGVPNMGIHSKNYEKFKGMLLDCTGNTRDFWALDPRYKEVREFLTETYAKALSEWNLDGLKLDFIDSMVLRGKSQEHDPRRDYVSLEDGVDALMTGIRKELYKINPDVLIEFRQGYVGPAIRKYGNMLRVADCPNDPIVNRRETVNLRLTSGNTAVHSDMLMWNYDEPVESAALQLISVLFSVPQISVRIARLCNEHKKMLEFYLSFWRAHRDILLEGRLTARSPETLYSLVLSQKDGRGVCAAYEERVIDMCGLSYLAAFNSTTEDSLVIKGAQGKNYRVLDCMGNEKAEGSFDSALCEIPVPMGGLIIIE